MAKRSQKQKPQEKAPARTEPTMIALEGRVRRPLTFNLDHNRYCKALGTCACTVGKVGVVKTSKVDGSRSPVFTNRRLCATLTVLWKRRVMVPEAVLAVPAVAAAVKARRIRVHR